MFFYLPRIYVSDSSVLTETLRGHHNAVWSVAFHASDNRLISASADGAVKLWEPGWAILDT